MALARVHGVLDGSLPNLVIGRQGRNELTLSFRPAPYLHTLLSVLLSELSGDDEDADCQPAESSSAACNRLVDGG